MLIPAPRLCPRSGTFLSRSTRQLFELVVLPQEPHLWQGLIPQDDRGLKRELLRAFLSYVGIPAQ
jgi:hypothetical protein